MRIILAGLVSSSVLLTGWDNFARAGVCEDLSRKAQGYAERFQQLVNTLDNDPKYRDARERCNLGNQAGIPLFEESLQTYAEYLSYCPYVAGPMNILQQQYEEYKSSIITDCSTSANNQDKSPSQDQSFAGGKIPEQCIIVGTPRNVLSSCAFKSGVPTYYTKVKTTEEYIKGCPRNVEVEYFDSYENKTRRESVSRSGSTIETCGGPPENVHIKN